MDFEINADEPNSILRKGFYALCRYKFEKNFNIISDEINKIFYQDAVEVIKYWVSDSYKVNGPFKREHLKVINLFKEPRVNIKDQSKCAYLLNKQLEIQRQIDSMTEKEKKT